MTIDFSRPAIVAHDAGAAQHLLAWMASGHLPYSEQRLCLAGPAAQLYQQQWGTAAPSHSIEQVLHQASVLVSGSGWASDLEHQARVWARQQGIASIAVLDHWVNYAQRFYARRDLQTQVCWPDYIWVVDDYAQALAQQHCPGIDVQLQPNQFLAQQCQQIAQYAAQDTPAKPGCSTVLFVMEPIRQRWGKSDEPGEFQALAFLLQHLRHLPLQPSVRIVIKPHPSDPAGKYQRWQCQQPNLRIDVDEHSRLAQLIAWADTVVGCHTYAMVVALAAGKYVVSALPPQAPSSCLPHTAIHHLRDAVASTDENV